MFMFSTFFVLVLSSPGVFSSKVVCSQTSECESALRPGSECIEGYCSNPLYKGGCLSTLIPGWDDVRICSSQDPPEAEAKGYCRKSPLGYAEVRILPYNWESTSVLTWMLQIILSELLQTPVSVEAGGFGLNSDLYNVNSHFESGTPNILSPLETSMEDITCLEGPKNADDYKECAHLVPEIYASYQAKLIGELVEKGVIETPIDNGFLAEDTIHVPFRTANRDPSLQSYLGLRLPETRRRAAESFLTPTRWGEYCETVDSANNCEQPNTVAARPPETDEEKAMLFSDGLFTGHFRKDFLNDCDANPDCKGFFVDYPCGWGPNTHQKLIHLDLPLEPFQFSYSEMVQIMAAANATQSDIIHWWWLPEPMHQVYEGTSSQFTPIYLPRATPECLNARTEYGSGTRCEVDPITAAGPKEGACEDPIQNIKMILATTLRQLSQNPDISPALWSPAYDVISKFRLSNDQIGEVFKLWQARGDVDKYNYDLRDATCQWMAENIDFARSFVPRDFPRVTKNIYASDSLVFHTLTLVVVAGGLLSILSTLVAVHFNKTKVAVFHAQAGILGISLLGLLLYTFGSLLPLLDANVATCGGSIWFLNIGYVLTIFPLISKLDAINRGSTEVSKRMQRIRLNRRQIVRPTALACCLVAAYLLVWSIVDQSRQVQNYTLTEELSERGDTIVHVTSKCGSNLSFWAPVMLLWRASLVLWGLILGLLASRNRDHMNGVNDLVMLFFSEAVFVAIQACLFYLQSMMERTAHIAALACTVESLLFICIYVLPKIFSRQSQEESDEPLPDLFLNTTVMMGDIVGFTKWSSMREPSQVFKLLESIYSGFDSIGDKLGIFKVETVGDCYVAASGIPNARKDHAVAMVRFASECLLSIKRLVRELEVSYGPDTGDLTLRIGLHSGPVTGGFLKGKGARFQLFGDVMNVTGRMESCGAPNMIHVSEATAEVLRLSGKSSWVVKRENTIDAKGKGKMQTYWINNDEVPRLAASKLGSEDQRSEEGDNDINEGRENRKARLVKWNVEVLASFLKEIVAHRHRTLPETVANLHRMLPGASLFPEIEDETSEPLTMDMPLNEVKEIITLPEFNAAAARVRPEDTAKMDLSDTLHDELSDFVTDIANMYRDNCFHSFSHASQVVLAVTKYMSRIVEAGVEAPTVDCSPKERQERAAKLHATTYGITGDPLTQFACVFAALIHDLDHPGVPNPQFVLENDSLAKAYEGRSLAEQNSLDLAWYLLMKKEYSELRNTIWTTHEEQSRFRQLVVNAVMATDLADKELKDLRNNRWKKAFSNEKTASVSSRDDMNRRATIVIEHLIQASDVAHTTQHWHVYRQWNENLFREMYAAFKAGRSDKSPVEGWYEGEIGFFDFYVIPLSQKLKDCGVFGVSSGENLSYAKSNRDEWVQRGKEVVAEMVDKLEREEDQGSPGAALAVKLEKRSHIMGKGGLHKHTTDEVMV